MAIKLNLGASPIWAKKGWHTLDHKLIESTEFAIAGNATNINDFNPKNPQQFICNNCNKCYKERSGLWRHKKTCKPNTDPINNFVLDKELVMMLIKENSELKTMMIEQQSMVMKVLENGTHNTTTTHTNSHNKAYNLNFF